MLTVDSNGAGKVGARAWPYPPVPSCHSFPSASRQNSISSGLICQSSLNEDIWRLRVVSSRLGVLGVLLPPVSLRCSAALSGCVAAESMMSTERWSELRLAVGETNGVCACAPRGVPQSHNRTHAGVSRALQRAALVVLWRHPRLHGAARSRTGLHKLQQRNRQHAAACSGATCNKLCTDTSVGLSREAQPPSLCLTGAAAICAHTPGAAQQAQAVLCPALSARWQIACSGESLEVSAQRGRAPGGGG